MQIFFWKPISRGRSLLLKGLRCIWSYAHLCLVKHAYLILCLNFNGIDKIAVGFTSKVDYRKSSKIMFKLSMLQKAPKRRSPNPFNYKLKWAETANVASTLTKCGLMRPSKLTVPSKRRSSKYVVFPERQPYFTYGDLHSSRVNIYAFQLTILQCKICCYSDCFKMCL